ncbi:ATP-binding protein [Streptomyces sp. NPDC020983]|uniref:ATP-binding protein n=1 Tax=Streptomyces sp. NPDC020983 TaxID=3365106 RepID=UPI00379FFECC
MTNKPAGPSDSSRPPAPDARLPAPAQPTAARGFETFEMRFTTTRRGARLARRMAALRLDAWGFPYGTEAHDEIVLIVGELAANAVTHGLVAGRDFHLRLQAAPRSGTARVEVTDARGERVPERPAFPDGVGDEESGRGLLLVSRLAVRWDWHPRPNGPGKTVWAEYAGAPGCGR